MVEVSLLGFVSVLFAWTSRFQNKYSGLKLSFMLIFLFTAFRYNFGTDYSGYHFLFDEVSERVKYSTINTEDFRIETGWLILNYLFKPFGFFSLIIVLSGIFCYTYYSLIRKYVPENYYWFAVFVYVFFYNLLLIQLSAIRQTLAISMFLFAISYIIEGKGTLKYMLIILFSSLFHSSSVFLLFLAIFNIKKVRESLNIGNILLFLFVFLLVFGQVISSYFPALLSAFTGSRYDVWYETEIESKVSLMGSMLWFILLYIVVLYSRTQNVEMRLIYNLCSMFFLVYPLTVLVFLSDRMGYYLAPFCMIVFSHVLSIEQSKIKRTGLLVIFMFFIMYNYLRFFTLDYVVDAQGYSVYQTIFSAF